MTKKYCIKIVRMTNVVQLKNYKPITQRNKGISIHLRLIPIKILTLKVPIQCTFYIVHCTPNHV